MEYQNLFPGKIRKHLKYRQQKSLPKVLSVKYCRRDYDHNFPVCKICPEITYRKVKIVYT